MLRFNFINMIPIYSYLEKVLCSLCLKATKHHSENRIAKCVRLFCMLAVLLFSSCSVMSDSLWHHGLQHTRLPCPSPSLRLCLNSCPLSWWCHSAISSFVVAFPSCLLSFPASGHFQMSQLFASCDQNISFNISPSSEYSGLISFRTNWFDLLAIQELSRVFSNTTVQKHQFFSAQLSL